MIATKAQTLGDNTVIWILTVGAETYGYVMCATLDTSKTWWIVMFCTSIFLHEIVINDLSGRTIADIDISK